MKKIGKLYNVSESAITEAARMFPKRMDKNEILFEEIKSVKAMQKMTARL